MTPWWGRFAILPSHVLSFCTFLHAGTASPARVAEKKYFWVIESTYLLQKNLTFLNHPSCGQMKISSSFVDQLSVCGNGFAENNIVVVVIFSNFAFVTIFQSCSNLKRVFLKGWLLFLGKQTKTQRIAFLCFLYFVSVSSFSVTRTNLGSGKF